FGLEAKELRRGLAEHGGALGVAESRRAEDLLDRRAGPAERIVGAEHELRGTDLCREVAQRFGREDQRVVIELAQVLRRFLLQLHRRAAVGEGDADLVRAIGVRGEIAAAVRRAELETREAVERALVDEMRERKRGLERVPDGVV